jgi:hypothetical protein
MKKNIETRKFIEKMSGFEYKKQIIESVKSELQNIKNKIKSYGYKLFKDGDLKDEIIGGQRFFNEGIDLAHYYIYLIFINKGLKNDRWVPNIDNLNSFDEIKIKVLDIFNSKKDHKNKAFL